MHGIANSHVADDSRRTLATVLAHKLDCRTRPEQLRPRNDGAERVEQRPFGLLEYIRRQVTVASLADVGAEARRDVADRKVGSTLFSCRCQS